MFFSKRPIYGISVANFCPALKLFEENLGAVSLQDGKLLFESEEAQTKVNAMYEEFKQVSRGMSSLQDKDHDLHTNLAMKLHKK